MNNFELCEGACNLYGTILGTGIIENANLVAMFARPESPIPDEKKFNTLFLQTEIIASITKSNSDFFGRSRFFSLYFDYFDMYFFPLSRYGTSERKGTLAVMVKAPYDHEDLVLKITNHLEKNLS